MKIVEVHWLDISLSYGWVDKGVAPVVEPIKCSSVGYFVKKSKSAITLTLTDSNNDKFGEVLTIPMGVVKKIRRIR